MTLVESITTVIFEKYATFSGRASRSEFWWFMLFSNSISFLIPFLYSIYGPSAEKQEYDLIEVILAIVLFLPQLAVTVRRLHDVDKSGWWILSSLATAGVTAMFVYVFLLLIVIDGMYILAVLSTIIMNFYVLYLLIKKGDTGPNRFDFILPSLPKL